ncbi:MAG: hypothetical protein ACK5KR_03490 [Breznakia sp.]
MNVFNTSNLRNKQRFPVAICTGLLAALVCGTMIGWIERFLSFNSTLIFSLMYIGAGYAIGEAIKRIGRGIDRKFQILAVTCVILTIFVADIVQFSMVFGFSFDLLVGSIEYTVSSYSLTNTGFYGVFELLIVVYGCYIAFFQARIV